jgi:hypothetical protein
MCAAGRGGRGGRGNGGAGGAGVGARRPTSYDGAFDTARVTRDHHQHGGDTGQLPAPSANVELVGELGLRNVPEEIAQVGVFKGFASLAHGVFIVCEGRRRAGRDDDRARHLGHPPAQRPGVRQRLRRHVGPRGGDPHEHADLAGLYIFRDRQLNRRLGLHGQRGRPGQPGRPRALLIRRPSNAVVAVA